MEQEQIEQATDIVIESIANSNLDNYIKLELLINLRLFFKDYDKNIRLLNKEGRKK